MPQSLRLSPGVPSAKSNCRTPGKMMRSIPVAALAGICLCCLLPMAQAQGIDSGLEFQVNPVAPGGGTLLLYPGGQYMRLVPALRHPAEAPLRRGAVVRTSAPAARPAAAPRPAPRVASVTPPPPRPQASTPPVRTAPAGTPPASNLLSNLPTISVASQASVAPPPAATPASPP